MARLKREFYEAHCAQVLEKVYSREGDKLTFNPVENETPLSIAIRGEEEASTRVDVEDLPSDLKDLAELDYEQLLALVLQLLEERDGVRENAQATMLNFFFGCGPSPLQVCERLFIFVRGLSPQHVWMARQNEAARLFCHIKQTWREMEKRMLEELAARVSSTGVFTLPGGKSWSARRQYAADKKGNTSKRLGRRIGDIEGEPSESASPADEGETEDAKARWERAERERLARELGCSPDEIDLTKISPDWD